MKKPYTASGRINLIGEHLDYNGGMVLPTTIDLGIHLWFKPSSDEKWKFYSDKHQSFELNFEADFPTEHGWFQYPLSVVRYLKEQKIPFPFAFELKYHSNLLEGSGLSSSAAILVVTLKAFNDFLNLNWSNKEIAKIAQYIENQYIGVNCGIMDSYVIAHNLWNSALLIDCNQLTHEVIPLPLGEKYKIWIMDTRLPRSLKSSDYNERRNSCEKALKQIQLNKSIQYLTEANIEDLDFLDEKIIKKRAKHVITEQIRVKEAVKCLKNQDFDTFGKLMNESHQSLKEDYEVSCEALDFLVEHIQKQKGCLGARMTGAGFGGCAIALTNQQFDTDFMKTLENQYQKKFRIQPNIFVGKERCFT